MRVKQSITTLAFLLVGTLALLMALVPTSLTAATSLSQRSAAAEPKPSDYQKRLIAAFNRHIKDYLGQRNRVRKKLPNLPKDATPEQIQAYQKSFVDGLIPMRAGTKAGYIFSSQMADHLRTIIKAEFKGTDRIELRETVLEADTKGVPLKVNFPYPETKELTQMPPTLLLKLPQLPKELKYRFVRQHMLLVDSDNNLIVDYMLNALP